MKRIAFALIAVVLVFAMLAGCGSNAPSGSAETSSSTVSSEASQSTAPAESTAAVSAVPENEVHLDWYYVGNKEETDNQLVSDEISKYTKEKINATVQMHVFDWGSFNQKVSTMLASGEKMDVLCTGSMLNVPQEVAKGSFLDITDLYQKYGTDIQKYMPEQLINGAKFDGKLYCVPFMNILGSQYGLVVRKDIAEKTGIDLSTLSKFADYTPFFEAAKKVEPNFTVKVNGLVNMALCSGYQQLGDGPGYLKGNSELKVVNPFEDPEIIANLKVIRDWYNAGYINKEAVNPSYNHTAALGENKLHGLFGQAKVGIEAEVSVGIGGKYEFAKTTMRTPVLDTYSSYFVSTVVPRTAPDAERSMMFINLLMGDPYVQNLSNYGIEGKHYVKLADGRIDFPEGSTPETLTYNPNLTWEWQNSYIQLLNKAYPVDFVDQLTKYNDTSAPSVALGFNFDAEPVKTQIAACANVDQEFQWTLAQGAVDIDSTIAKMMEKYKAAGINEVIAEKQKQLDTWAAANGKK